MDTTTLNQKCMKEAEMDVIRDFVYRFREQRGIKEAPYTKMSLSGEMFGEGMITLYEGLIPTTESYGVWNALEDDDTRRMVLKQVVADQYILRK